MGLIDGPETPPSLASLKAGGPISLFLDFDGTLVDIAPGPDAIHVPNTLAASLTRLNAQCNGRLALISGRALDDIEKHLGPVSIARAGSHGADCRDARGNSMGAAARPLESGIIAEMARFAEELGLDLERKSHGAALHFRSSPDLEARAIGFAAELAGRNDLSIKTGKCVVEVMAKGADKGQAVNTYMHCAPFAGSRPWFIGDDVTDEDGFAACAQLGGGGILVGTKNQTSARYSLPDVAGVYEWLGL
jgi:trehalose 6-phosphate phosphatase